jgi:hypothetical protein
VDPPGPCRRATPHLPGEPGLIPTLFPRNRQLRLGLLRDNCERSLLLPVTCGVGDPQTAQTHSAADRPADPLKMTRRALATAPFGIAQPPSAGDSRSFNPRLAPSREHPMEVLAAADGITCDSTLPARSTLLGTRHPAEPGEWTQPRRERGRRLKPLASTRRDLANRFAG